MFSLEHQPTRMPYLRAPLLEHTQRAGLCTVAHLLKPGLVTLAPFSETVDDSGRFWLPIRLVQLLPEGRACNPASKRKKAWASGV